MQGSPLNVLITNLQLSGRNGTEIVTRDLALGLRRLGHRPIILTQADGPIATELRERSIPVATDIGQIGAPVDVIHAHHTHMAAIAIARFPGAPCVFLAHDFLAWSDAPPMLPWVPRYDLVFASALTALEAMACGRAVVVCDGRGLAGFVSPERFAHWRSCNFGLRTLAPEVSTSGVLREIDAYDAGSAAEVGRRVRQEAGLDSWLAA